jgi:hypothetical protein
MTTAAMTESTALPPAIPASATLRYIAYAASNQRLAIATALVSIPTFWFWLGVIAFAISISIYGF